jgi:hypothetical protein
MEKCKQHQPKKWALIALMVPLLALTAYMIVCIVWLLRPYDEVRFGSDESEVLQDTVIQGQQLTVRNPSFCVDNVDTHVERWADAYDDDGVRVASFQMFSVEFYGEGRGERCSSPSIVTITLPNYVVGTGPTEFRLRQIITYRPNPVRVVTVDVTTEPFTLIPNYKEPKNG